MTFHAALAVVVGLCALVAIGAVGTRPGVAGSSTGDPARVQACATPGAASPPASPNATPDSTPLASPAATPGASSAATPCLVTDPTVGTPGEPSPTTALAIDPAAGPAVSAARTDAASRLGGTPDDYAVVSVESVDWPDASLGCPGDGFAAQVITPGYLIRLATPDGGTIDYHTNADGSVVVTCD